MRGLRSFYRVMVTQLHAAGAHASYVHLHRRGRHGLAGLRTFYTLIATQVISQTGSYMSSIARDNPDHAPPEGQQVVVA
jgi:hypothetical protein